VILAGGLGTRMRSLTEGRPKALMPVLGRPFVDWQLELVARQGIDRVVLSIGYGGQLIREHVGDGAGFGLSVTWVDEGPHLRGTGGALRLALDAGALAPAFFVLYGDSYLPIDYAAVEGAWRQSGLPALMTVLLNDGRWDASNTIYESGRVQLYDKSRPSDRLAEMRWIDYGLSVLTREVVRDRIDSGMVADLADVMHDLSLAGMLAGFPVAARFYEVGSPSGLKDLEEYLGLASGRHGPVPE
jgi:NDP-sugar pyrophosphorylase family protein